MVHKEKEEFRYPNPFCVCMILFFELFSKTKSSTTCDSTSC